MTTALPTEDADLVVLARRGGVDAFAVLYERYFAEVFDFLTRLLRDRDEAADVAQDTFVKAFERLGHLKNPASFRSWLFTIAHRNALNRIKRSKRAIAVGGFTDIEVEERSSLAVITIDLRDDPQHQVEIKEAAEIVWEAAAGLDARTYTVMDLHVRHGLDSSEIAEVLGVTKGNAYTMVSRMKKSVSDTMATYMLVRKGRTECDDLARIVETHGGPELTPDLRRAVDKHARECGVCNEKRRTLFSPLKLFAALAAVPAPGALQSTIFGAATATTATGAAAAGAAASIGANGSSATTAGGTAAAGAGSGTAAAGAAVTTTGTATAAGAATAVVAGTGAQGIAGIAAGVLLLVAAAAGTIAVVTSDDVPAGLTAPNQQVTEAPSTTAPSASADPETSDPGGPGVIVDPDEPAEDPSGEEDPRSALPPLLVRDDFVVAAEDTVVTIDLASNDAGVDSGGTAMKLGPPPTNGTAVLSGSVVTYRPAADFNGTDSFSYTVNRSDNQSATGTVRLTITPVNDAPRSTAPTTLAAVEDSVLRLEPLAGITDPEGDPIRIVAYDRVTDQGGVVSSGVGAYVPAADFNGQDSFSYEVSDGHDSLTIAVSVVVEARNDAPRHGVLSVSGREDVDISFDGLSGWFDVEGDGLAIASRGEVRTEAGGTASIAVDGAITYRPPLDHFGADSFAYEVTDGASRATGTVAVSLIAVNDAPMVGDLAEAIDEGAAGGTTIGILAASDVDDTELSFVVTGGDSNWLAVGAGGRVTAVRELDHEAAPALEIVGDVVDSGGLRDHFTVTVEVRDVPEAPHLADHEFVIEAGAAPNTVVGTVVASDDDAGDSVTFAILDDPNQVLKIDAQSGEVTLARRGLGRLFPLVVRIRATDTTGNVATAEMMVRAHDADGPRIARPLVDNFVVYEALAPGQGCPLGPSRARIGTSVTDPSGIDSVVLDWEAVFNGTKVSGITAMAFDDPYATGSFSFEAGLVPEGESTLFEAVIVATDGAGNRSRSAPIVITVRSCDVPIG